MITMWLTKTIGGVWSSVYLWMCFFHPYISCTLWNWSQWVCLSCCSISLQPWFGFGCVYLLRGKSHQGQRTLPLLRFTVMQIPLQRWQTSRREHENTHLQNAKRPIMQRAVCRQPSNACQFQKSPVFRKWSLKRNKTSSSPVLNMKWEKKGNKITVFDLLSSK